MKIEEKDLRERYANLSEYDLADILRSADLTDIAKKCLADELSSRGIDNLEMEIDELNKTDKNLEKRSEEIISQKTVSVKRFSKIFYLAGIVFIIIGLANYLYSLSKTSIIGGAPKTEQFGPITIFLGCVMIFYTWIRTTIKLIQIKILYRK